MINRERLLQQLKSDEGFRSTAYWDREQWTYGYGCEAPSLGATITEAAASELLEERLGVAVGDFCNVFSGHLQKFNDVRAEAFINITFHVGKTKLLKFVKTLSLIRDYEGPVWNAVGEELKRSAWYTQVGARAVRLVHEVKLGVK